MTMPSAHVRTRQLYLARDVSDAFRLTIEQHGKPAMGTLDRLNEGRII
jgi:hypothetical protein